MAKMFGGEAKASIPPPLPAPAPMPDPDSPEAREAARKKLLSRSTGRMSTILTAPGGGMLSGGGAGSGSDATGGSDFGSSSSGVLGAR